MASTIMSSSLFTPRFVPHRLVWKNEDDVCYECIDRNSYASVIVRLRKFETSDMETYKMNIAKAEKEAIVHECLANLCEIIIDEANKIAITVSDNPRGISFIKFVEAYSPQKDFNGFLQQILIKVAGLYQILNESGKDLCSLSLQHLILVINDNKLESVKVRRPFLAALTRRSLLTPYSRYQNANPAFVDLASMAFYGFTQKHLFDIENLDEALNLLETRQRSFFNQLLNASSNEAVFALLPKLTSDEELGDTVECDASSETSSFGVCEDEIDAVSSDSDYDIVNESSVKSASVAADDEDDTKTAIEADDDDETKTAIEADDDDEVKTAIGDDEDEVKTAIDENEDELASVTCEESETETAFEDGDYEFNASHVDDDAKTAIENDDDEVKTAIDEDETQSVLEDEEIKTAIGDDDFSTVGESGFGLHIPHLHQVFKCHPKFKLNFACLTVEGNTLVYKRQLSATNYRKLVVYCEDGEIDYVTYEYCYGGIRGKCSDAVTYKRFGNMCPDANFCLLEVYIAVSNALSTEPIYTFKDYSVQGLTVIFMANKEIHCTLEDQFITFTKDGQELASSDSQDKMPAVDFLTKIVADLSKMASSFEETTQKKFTITFAEQ